MKAVVFAAGIGSRLKPFTDKHPKALAPIGDNTALGVVLDKLIGAGADAIVVNVHHFAKQVIDFIQKKKYAVDIEISDETDMLLDTGGGLLKMFRESVTLSSLKPEEAVVVHNADIITDFKIKDMTRSLRGHDAALLVDPLRKSSRSFLFDKNNRLEGWTNNSTGAVRPKGIKPEKFKAAPFGGVHIVYKTTLNKLDGYRKDIEPFSIVDFYLDNLHSLDITAYTPTEPYRWFDIGTPEKLEAAQKAM